MSVSKKLNLSFALLLIIVFLGLSLLLQQFYRINNQVEEMMDERVSQIQIGKEIQRAIATQGMFIRAYILDPSDFNIDRLNTYNTLLGDEVQKLKTVNQDTQATELINKLEMASTTIIDAANQAIAVFDSGSETQALAIVNNEFANANAEIFALTVSLQELQQQKLDEIDQRTDRTITISTMLAVVAIVLNCAIIIALTIFVTVKIAKPLRRVTIEADYIANGDLTREDFMHTSKDEIGKLANAFNQLKNNLRGVLGSIQVNTEHLSSSAEELAASTNEGLSAVVKGVDIINNTQNAFTSINGAIGNVVEQVQEISAASEQISASAEQVTASVSQMANGSKEFVGDFEMIAAATEEQSATMEQINDVSIELSQNAQDLNELVRKFKL